MAVNTRGGKKLGKGMREPPVEMVLTLSLVRIWVIQLLIVTLRSYFVLYFQKNRIHEDGRLCYGGGGRKLEDHTSTHTQEAEGVSKKYNKAPNSHRAPPVTYFLQQGFTSWRLHSLPNSTTSWEMRVQCIRPWRPLLIHTTMKVTWKFFTSKIKEFFTISFG